MSIGLILLATAAALGLVWFAAGRVVLPRRSGLQAIDDRTVADAYDRISDWPQFRVLRRIVAGRLERCHPHGLLVDIGCGPGRLVTLIAQRHPGLRVIGIDAAEEMIRAAASNAASVDLAQRVEFRLGDVVDLPLPDGVVDWAVSTLSLHHWPDPARGFVEIHRVLKPGGQLLLFDLRRDLRRFFYWLMRFAQGVVVPAALRQAKEPLGSALSSYTPEEIHGMLVSLPFKEWRMEGGAGWVFVWVAKELADAAARDPRLAEE